MGGKCIRQAHSKVVIPIAHLPLRVLPNGRHLIARAFWTLKLLLNIRFQRKSIGLTFSKRTRKISSLGRIAFSLHSSRSVLMGKYLLGWILGIPTVVLVVIYLISN